MPKLKRFSDVRVCAGDDDGDWNGKVVKRVRRLTMAELEHNSWAERRPADTWAAVEFTDGSILFAACDPSGNGPGCLFGQLVE